MKILRKEERPVAIVALIVFAALNALLIANHWQSFTRGAHVGFWSVFYNHLNMSGYDIFSLIFISCMRLHWNALRHPLFVVVLLPLFGLNRLIMPPTEFNAAVLLMASLLVAADVWGAVLMHRLLRDVVEVRRVDAATLATWLQPAPGHTLEEHLYVVDPQGHWMMRFPARLDRAGAAKAKRDLDRLLRASASWDQPGRLQEAP